MKASLISLLAFAANISQFTLSFVTLVLYLTSTFAAVIDIEARSDATKLTQAQAAKKLKAAKITAVSSGHCTSKYETLPLFAHSLNIILLLQIQRKMHILLGYTYRNCQRRNRSQESRQARDTDHHWRD